MSAYLAFDESVVAIKELLPRGVAQCRSAGG
jgi:hypothetical protein